MCVLFFFVLHANECTVIHKANPKRLRNSVNFQEQMCSLFVSFIVNHVQFDFYIYTSFFNFVSIRFCIGVFSFVFFFLETKLFF